MWHFPVGCIDSRQQKLELELSKFDSTIGELSESQDTSTFSSFIPTRPSGSMSPEPSAGIASSDQLLSCGATRIRRSLIGANRGDPRTHSKCGNQALELLRMTDATSSIPGKGGGVQAQVGGEFSYARGWISKRFRRCYTPLRCFVSPPTGR
jgi:hypothetical protein